MNDSAKLRGFKAGFDRFAGDPVPVAPGPVAEVPVVDIAQQWNSARLARPVL